VISIKILVACEFSQVVTRAFRDNGHEAYSCDILPTEGNTDWHIIGNVLDILDNNFDMMIAHPPCTYLAVCGNRWMENNPEREELREEAVAFFMTLAECDIPKKCIENPVGIMSTRWRKPDQYIQPYEYGHPETKKTGLWLEGLPKLIPTNIVTPEYIIGKDGNRYSRIHYMSQWSNPNDRAKERSRTYAGIAKAMAAQWSGQHGQNTICKKRI